MTSVINYFKESARELGKINWPSRELTIRLTIAVAVFSLVLAIFMGVIDLGLNAVVKRFIIEG